jgi:hypothetical protein
MKGCIFYFLIVLAGCTQLTDIGDYSEKSFIKIHNLGEYPVEINSGDTLTSFPDFKVSASHSHTLSLTVLSMYPEKKLDASDGVRVSFNAPDTNEYRLADLNYQLTIDSNVCGGWYAIEALAQWEHVIQTRRFNFEVKGEPSCSDTAGVHSVNFVWNTPDTLGGAYISLEKEELYDIADFPGSLAGMVDFKIGYSKWKKAFLLYSPAVSKSAWDSLYKITSPVPGSFQDHGEIARFYKLGQIGEPRTIGDIRRAIDASKNESSKTGDFAELKDGQWWGVDGFSKHKMFNVKLTEERLELVFYYNDVPPCVKPQLCKNSVGGESDGFSRRVTMKVKY